MTLCAAWKTDNRISLASDSRVSFGNNGHADVGIKVVPLDVCVHGATREDTGETELLYRHTWGLCFAGNFCAAYSVREFLSGFMANLQYATTSGSLSMEDLCNLILEFYRRTTIELTLPLREMGEFELVTAGFCPASQRLRAFSFKFEFDTSKQMKQPSFREVLTDTPYYYFGKECADAETAYLAGAEKSNDSRVLASIRHVIDLTTHSSVGGALQFGSFIGADFYVYGLQESYENEHGLLAARFTYRGHSLQDGERDLIMGQFISRITFMMPFFEKERKYFDQDKLDY